MAKQFRGMTRWLGADCKPIRSRTVHINKYAAMGAEGRSGVRAVRMSRQQAEFIGHTTEKGESDAEIQVKRLHSQGPKFPR